MRDDLLTVQAAADIIGVSASTLKRICESESIPVIRTPGGHRRIDRIDLARIASMHGRSRKPHPHECMIQSDISTDQVIEMLVAGKALEVARLFSRGACNGMDLLIAIEDHLVSALWSVGQKWREKGLDIYQEHLCTSTAQTVLDILRNQIAVPKENAAVAVGGSFSPSIDTFSSKLVGFGCHIAGFRAVDLGGYLPADSLANAATDLKAKIVWVTHTHIFDVDQLLKNHEMLRERTPTDVRIVVGGGGLSPTIRRSLPWCEYYESVSAMAKHECGLHESAT